MPEARDVRRGTTPSQTVGPYLGLGLPWDEGPHAAAPGTPGAIVLHGLVLDGEGEPVPDALVETWQAAPDGGFGHAWHDPGDDVDGGAVADGHDRTGGGPVDRGADDGGTGPAEFRGFARSPTSPDGRWAVTTLKPGRVPTPDGRRWQAPHVDVSVFARGLLHRVVTRLYFDDEAAANADDPLLRTVDPDRRATLVAVADDAGYRLDIVLQGPRETVFFDL
jgi:protocatechuate 3,4-dioxygenase alpha subunit